MWKQPHVERALSAAEGVAGICADFGFRDAQGRPQRAGCLAALRELEAAGRVRLPPPRRGRPPSVPDVLPAIHPEAPDLASLGTVELVAVDDDALRRVWTQLLHHEHARGPGPFFGTQPRPRPRAP